MENVILVFSGMLFFWFIYAVEQSFFYKQEIKYCDKFKGHCELCNCWSCKRKTYIDEFKEVNNVKL